MDLPEQWKERLCAGRFPQVLILSGGAGAQASWLAAALLCLNAEKAPCGDCPSCHKVAEKIHPDCRFYEDGAGCKVDEMRELRTDAYLRPNESARKVYVFQDAAGMTIQAQNALLKLLEEGPLYAHYLFVLPNEEQLLPTLRSRAETLFLPETSEPEMTEEARTFCALLAAGAVPNLALCRFLIGLEKLDRSAWERFLSLSIAQYAKEHGEDTARMLHNLAVLQRAKAATERNIGTGHLTGSLLAELV